MEIIFPLDYPSFLSLSLAATQAIHNGMLQGQNPAEQPIDTARPAYQKAGEAVHEAVKISLEPARISNVKV